MIYIYIYIYKTWLEIRKTFYSKTSTTILYFAKKGKNEKEVNGVCTNGMSNPFWTKLELRMQV